MSIWVKNMETKIKIRKKILSERLAYPKDRQKEDAHRVCKKLICMPEILKAETLLLYWAKEPELSLEELFDWGIAKKKKIYLPKVVGEEMNFYRVGSREDLIQGYFQIMEPKSQKEPFGDEKAVCLLPGVAFDTRGNRIGYGKGFYDKFLQKKEGILKLGVGYDFQVLDTWQADLFDEKLDKMVTPQRYLNFR